MVVRVSYIAYSLFLHGNCRQLTNLTTTKIKSLTNRACYGTIPLQSEMVKDALSKWLLTFDVQKTKALPDGTQELFERIFGERHFSLKCFVRSAAFSVGAMAFLSIVLLLINPVSFITSFSAMGERYEHDFRNPDDPTAWAAFSILAGLWLLWSIVIDYISLFKTRVILGLLVRMHQKYIIAAVAILAMDYLIYRFLFFVGITIVGPLWELAS